MEFNDVELLFLPKMRIKLTVISVDRIKLAGVELIPFFPMFDFPELKNVLHARSTSKMVNSAFKYKETLRAVIPPAVHSWIPLDLEISSGLSPELHRRTPQGIPYEIPTD